MEPLNSTALAQAHRSSIQPLYLYGITNSCGARKKQDYLITILAIYYTNGHIIGKIVNIIAKYFAYVAILQ